MMHNAALLDKKVQVHDQELSQYAQRELMSSVAALKGRHESNRPVRHRPRPRPGPVRRAGRWLSHGLMVLLS